MSLGVQLAVAGGIALVGVIIFAVSGPSGRPRRRRRPIRHTWACSVDGQVWTWTAELRGGVWSLTNDRGEGGLFGSVYEVRQWVGRDVAKRLAERPR